MITPHSYGYQSAMTVLEKDIRTSGNPVETEGGAMRENPAITRPRAKRSTQVAISHKDHKTLCKAFRSPGNLLSKRFPLIYSFTTCALSSIIPSLQVYNDLNTMYVGSSHRLLRPCILGLDEPKLVIPELTKNLD